MCFDLKIVNIHFQREDQLVRRRHRVGQPQTEAQPEVFAVCFSIF